MCLKPEVIDAEFKKRNYDFFLNQPNFLMVADTLEKYELYLADQTS